VQHKVSPGPHATAPWRGARTTLPCAPHAATLTGTYRWTPGCSAHAQPRSSCAHGSGGWGWDPVAMGCKPPLSALWACCPMAARVGAPPGCKMNVELQALISSLQLPTHLLVLDPHLLARKLLRVEVDEQVARDLACEHLRSARGLQVERRWTVCSLLPKRSGWSTQRASPAKSGANCWLLISYFLEPKNLSARQQ